jgi:hypothetical protein
MRKVLEGFDFNPPLHTFDQDDFAAMTDALGIDSLDGEHRAVLQRECDRFLAMIASWDQASRPGEVRKKLEKVHSDTARLMTTLHALHETKVPDRQARQSTLALLHAVTPGNDWADMDTDLMAFTERLAELGKAANTVLHELPRDGGGPSGDLPLEVLADGLASLFTEITKKSPSITSDPYAESEEEFRGRFLDFVEAFLRPLAPHYKKKRRTLGKALKRIRSSRTHSK